MWALVGVVVGALLGGGAQIVAGVLTDRRAHRRWLREQRVDAYRDVMQRADEELRELREAPERREDGLLRWDYDGGIGECLPPVEFFGSAGVAAAARDLADAFSGFAHTMPGFDDLSTQMATVTKAREDYLAAVRLDLGVGR